MLRLIHNQTVPGSILIDDIDDGLPNKNAHVFGSMANPDAYPQTGYANAPKQPCYIPRTKPTDSNVKGYIDVRETERVVHSAGKGKIHGFAQAGMIKVVQFLHTDIAQPTVTTASIDTPAVGDLTIVGTDMLSLEPNESKVVITGTGAVTLTRTQILAAGGVAAFTNTSVVIPAALIPGVAAATSSVKVIADDMESSTIAVA